MKCGRPKWMLRQLFQVFFLVILLVLVVVTVLAYLVYFLPAYLPISLKSLEEQLPSSSYHHYRFPQQKLNQNEGEGRLGNIQINDISHRLSSGGGGSPQEDLFPTHTQDLQLISLDDAPIRHVSSKVKANKQEEQSHYHRELENNKNGKDWLPYPLHSQEDFGSGTDYKKKCSMFNCFDIHRCGGGSRGRDGSSSTNDSLSIYIYPIYQWVVDGKKLQTYLSREFYQLLQSIKLSPYYVSDPNLACIFVPSIDLLNLNKLAASSDDVLAVLSSLEFWGNAGQNHLLLTMFPGNSPLYQLKTNAIIASSGFFSEHYRFGFHITVITPSPLLFFNNLRSSSSVNSLRTLNGGSSRNDINNYNIKDSDTDINAIKYDVDAAAPSYQRQLQVKNHHWVAVAVRQGAFSFNDLLSSANHDNSILLLDHCHNKNNHESEKTQQINKYSVRCTTSAINKGLFHNELFPYPDILQEFDFCLVIRDLSGPLLWEVMSAGCIPVIIADHQRLPFDEFIDWRRNSIQLYERQMHQLSSILSSVTNRRRQRLKAQVQWTFQKYFKDMRAITGTVIMTLNARVFTHYAKSIQEWNSEEKGDTLQKNFAAAISGAALENNNASASLLLYNNVQSPLFNPITVSKSSGFTAVILAYERVASLFSVIQRVAQAPSVAKILVIWNNQLKDPPSLDSWPKVGVAVKIIKATSNKMSNRFFPYDEIDTEAVFSLDDDIVMLTVDEMEFGFETWKEYPDRLVGFPSRSHFWDNTTLRWKYESEWKSEISMVLTGAAFYHKYWHHAYTHELSRDIREWVDSKMNCEDIAMNFLVAASTGKSPIKVTPRKKFKCPTCSNNEMLSSDSGHMGERTDCINKFTQILGFMPLLPTEFRADPLLFKVDGVPKRLKQYHDMGTL